MSGFSAYCKLIAEITSVNRVYNVNICGPHGVVDLSRPQQMYNNGDFRRLAAPLAVRDMRSSFESTFDAIKTKDEQPLAEFFDSMRSTMSDETEERPDIVNLTRDELLYLAATEARLSVGEGGAKAWVDKSKYVKRMKISNLSPVAFMWQIKGDLDDRSMVIADLESMDEESMISVMDTFFKVMVSRDVKMVFHLGSSASFLSTMLSMYKFRMDDHIGCYVWRGNITVQIKDVGGSWVLVSF